ncbi:unnamed protein product [Leuciscus chuanchicus]
MLRWLSSRPTRSSHVKSPGGISLGCYRKLEIEPSAAACGVLRGMQGCLWGYDLRHPLFPARGAEIMGKGAMTGLKTFQLLCLVASSSAWDDLENTPSKLTMERKLPCQQPLADISCLGPLSSEITPFPFNGSFLLT